MAKRKIIWSRTAKKKLYSFFESDIRKGIDKSAVKGKFNSLFNHVKLLKKHPETGACTTDKSIFGWITDSFIIFYGFSSDMIIIHSIIAN